MRALPLVLLILAPFSPAQALVGFELPLPVDQALVEGSCENAFEQALQDKKDYESRPGVNLLCAYNLGGDMLVQLRSGFMNNCRRTIGVRETNAQSLGHDRVTMDVTALRAAFDGEYGMIFRRDCLDSAMRDFYRAKAQVAAQQQTQQAVDSISPMSVCGRNRTCQSEAQR